MQSFRQNRSDWADIQRTLRWHGLVMGPAVLTASLTSILDPQNALPIAISSLHELGGSVFRHAIPFVCLSTLFSDSFIVHFDDSFNPESLLNNLLSNAIRYNIYTSALNPKKTPK